MIGALERAGHRIVEDPGEASVIIVNTCGFIQPAKQESIDVSLQFVTDYPHTPVVMAGCLSQRYAADLDAEMPELTGFLGNRAPDRIVDELHRVFAGERVVIDRAPTTDPPLRTRLLSLPGSAYLKVAEGCNNRCSFCAIPLIRGGQRSRAIRSIVAEANALLDSGVTEINLVAQDLGSFGRDRGRTELVDMLRALTADPRQFWLRLLYIHPEHLPTDLLSLMSDDPRILPYFDLPFQHSSQQVLAAMGRSGNAERYLALLQQVRETVPDAVIRSTALVGFDREDEAAFAELCEFQEAAHFDWLGVFVYSPEEGTPAYRATPTGRPARNGRPSAKVAAERRDHLMQRQQTISAQQMQRFVGRTLDVLVEEMVSEEPLALGRAFPHAPEVDGAVVVHATDDVRPGAVTQCNVVRSNGLDLEAMPI